MKLQMAGFMSAPGSLVSQIPLLREALAKPGVRQHVCTAGGAQTRALRLCAKLLDQQLDQQLDQFWGPWCSLSHGSSQWGPCPLTWHCFFKLI